MGIFTREEHMEIDEEGKAKWKTDKKGLNDKLGNIKKKFQKSDFDKQVAELEKRQKYEARLEKLKKRAETTKKHTQTQKLKEDISKLKKQQRDVKVAKTRRTIKKIDNSLDTIFGKPTSKKTSYGIFGSPTGTSSYKSPFSSPSRPKTHKTKSKTKYIVRGGKAYPIAQKQHSTRKKPVKKKKSSDIFNPSGIDWGL